VVECRRRLNPGQGESSRSLLCLFLIVRYDCIGLGGSEEVRVSIYLIQHHTIHSEGHFGDLVRIHGCIMPLGLLLQGVMERRRIYLVVEIYPLLVSFVPLRLILSFN
jgi:hypothetical protein